MAMVRMMRWKLKLTTAMLEADIREVFSVLCTARLRPGPKEASSLKKELSLLPTIQD